MRCIIFSTTALISVGVVAATPSFAAKKEGTNVANMSVTQSFNTCVELAKQRGFGLDGLEGSAGNNSARSFVIRCMQGKRR